MDRLIDGRYRLGSEVGSGGMATVHRAWDTRLERAVAVKLYRPNADRAEHRRFHDEARTLAGLSHPGLVTVYDSGTTENGPYLVMRLIDGQTLRGRITDGPLAPHEVRTLGARLADALAAVHDGGVIHRDVKPSNVLLDRDGAPHLADFGVSLLADAARLTATGQFLGTAAYLAPEQALGHAIGPSVDVYALGLVLLECLTGRTEYTGTDVEAVVARLYRAPRLSADVPADLAALITAMTDLDPAARPSAAGGAAALARPTPVTTPVAVSAATPAATPIAMSAAMSAAMPAAMPVVTPVEPAVAAPKHATAAAAERREPAATGALPVVAVAPPVPPPVRLSPPLSPARRFAGVAAGVAMIAAAMTWAVSSHAQPGAELGSDPAERTLVGVVPARQELTTTTQAPQPAAPAPAPAPQVVTEVVTVVVPQPAPAAAEPKQGKEKGKKRGHGDGGDDDDD